MFFMSPTGTFFICSVNRERSLLFVLPAGIEPASIPSEGTILSIERRKQIPYTCPNTENPAFAGYGCAPGRIRTYVAGRRQIYSLL